MNELGTIIYNTDGDKAKVDIATQEYQFAELLKIINTHRQRAMQAVNNELLTTAWFVGEYVSAKIQSEQWGSKVVSLFAEYVRSNQPNLKGYSRRNIYNMVMFYEEYSKAEFCNLVEKYIEKGNDVIVQFETAQLPKILTLITLTHHIEILSNCPTVEERLFYILYTHKEHLKISELKRCIANHTFSSLLSPKTNLSKRLIETYPTAPFIFKDKLFVDFLNLPPKYSESKLKSEMITHIKEFILELGKDFLYVDQEYRLEVGSSTFKSDLLFFHRGLQALVAVEVKKTKFHPRDLGQLEFYLEALDRDVKRTNENPSIGILLCPQADKIVVEYAMSRSMSPTMIAEYKQILIPVEQMQIALDEYCQLIMDKR